MFVGFRIEAATTLGLGMQQVASKRLNYVQASTL